MLRLLGRGCPRRWASCAVLACLVCLSVDGARKSRRSTFGIDHVFDAHGDSMQRSSLLWGDPIETASLFEHEIAIQIRPGSCMVVAGVDTGQQSTGVFLDGELVGADLLEGLEGG